MKSIDKIINTKFEDVSKEDFQILIDYINNLENYYKPEECEHLYYTSQGLGRSSFCSQCGIEL